MPEIQTPPPLRFVTAEELLPGYNPDAVGNTVVVPTYTAYAGRILVGLLIRSETGWDIDVMRLQGELPLLSDEKAKEEFREYFAEWFAGFWEER